MSVLERTARMGAPLEVGVSGWEEAKSEWLMAKLGMRFWVLAMLLLWPQLSCSKTLLLFPDRSKIWADGLLRLGVRNVTDELIFLMSFSFAWPLTVGCCERDCQEAAAPKCPMGWNKQSWIKRECCCHHPSVNVFLVALPALAHSRGSRVLGYIFLYAPLQLSLA